MTADEAREGLKEIKAAAGSLTGSDKEPVGESSQGTPPLSSFLHECWRVGRLIRVPTGEACPECGYREATPPPEAAADTDEAALARGRLKVISPKTPELRSAIAEAIRNAEAPLRAEVARLKVTSYAYLGPIVDERTKERDEARARADGLERQLVKISDACDRSRLPKNEWVDIADMAIAQLAACREAAKEALGDTPGQFSSLFELGDTAAKYPEYRARCVEKKDEIEARLRAVVREGEA